MQQTFEEKGQREMSVEFINSAKLVMRRCGEYGFSLRLK
jgi:hypothetical protein